MTTPGDDVPFGLDPTPAAAAPAMGARVTSGIAWQMTNAVGNRVLSMAAQLVLAGRLGKADYALLTVVIGVTSITNVLRDGGVSQTLINRSPDYERWSNASFWMSLCLGGASTLATLAAIPIASRVFHRDDLVLPLVVAAATLLATAFSVVPTATLQRAFRFGVIARVSIALNVVNYALTIALALLHFGVLAILIPNLINACLLAAIYWRASGQRVWPRLELAKWPSIAGESVWFVATASLGFLAFQQDFTLLNHFVDTDDAGAYGFAQIVATQASQLIVAAANSVLFPALVTLRNDPERQRAGFLRSCRLLAIVAIPACIGQALIFPPLLTLLYHGKWDAAARMVEIFSVAMAFIVFGGLSIALLQSKGQLRRAFAWTCGVSVCFVVAVLIGLPHGAIGVSWSVATFYAIAGPLGVAFAMGLTRRNLRDTAGIFAPPMLAVLPAFGVGLLVRARLADASALWQLVVPGTLFALLALAGIAIVRRAELAELYSLTAEKLVGKLSRFRSAPSRSI